MSSQLDIYNLSLSHLGMKSLSSASDTTSPSGKACNQYYEAVRNDVFRELQWPFATVQTVLELSNDTARYGWLFMYIYPTNALTVWRTFNAATAGFNGGITSLSQLLFPPFTAILGNTQYTEDFEVQYFPNATPDAYAAGTTYAVGDYVVSVALTYICIQAGAGHAPASSPTYWTATTWNTKVILTNLEEAYAEYTYLVTDTTLWDSKFVMALSYRMAASMAHILLGDATKGEKLMGVYNLVLQEAKRISFSEKRKKPIQTSGYQNSR